MRILGATGATGDTGNTAKSKIIGNTENTKQTCYHSTNPKLLSKLMGISERPTEQTSNINLCLKTFTLALVLGIGSLALMVNLPKLEGNPSLGNQALPLDLKSASQRQNHLGKVDQPQTPTLITTREAAAKAKTYKESIKALETPPTITDEEVKDQGFVIRAIDSYKVSHTAPDIAPATANNSQNLARNSVLNTQINSIASKSYTEAQNVTKRTRNAIEEFSSDQVSHAKKLIQGTTSALRNSSYYSTASNTNEDHHYSMDATNRRILLTNAKSLSIGTPRSVAKKLLGRPSKETVIALPEDGELAKMLVYSIKIWKQGISTPDKDEKLILLFNSEDRLLSAGLNNATQDNYRVSQFQTFAKNVNNNNPKLASIRMP